MAQEIEIRQVITPKDRTAFIMFPFGLYRNDRNWVPPLISERQEFFDPARHPFYKHADVALFLALRDGKVVGTIAALINHRHNEFHNERTGFFGFFEVIEDYAVAERLLATARDWVKERKMDRIRGPMNFSTNEECGLLVDGFDSPPVVFMTYNPRYYEDFLLRFGFTKAMDLWAYLLTAEGVNPDGSGFQPKVLRVVEDVRKRLGTVVIRPADMKHFDSEIERFKAVYNSAWERNWGFVPMTDEEVDHFARGAKGFLDPELVFVAEDQGKPIGFSLTLPDINQALMRVHGRLFPFGWIPFLLDRRRIDTARVFAMGVIEGYRSRGIDAIFYFETAKAIVRRGYRRAEMSWILENNVMMNRLIQMMGGKVYKTYRVYDLPL
jgi:GNAT superfamily N-acetyltransferase